MKLYILTVLIFTSCLSGNVQADKPDEITLIKFYSGVRLIYEGTTTGTSIYIRRGNSIARFIELKTGDPIEVSGSCILRTFKQGELK